VGIYRGFFFGGYDVAKRLLPVVHHSKEERVKIFFERWAAAGATSLIGVFLSRPFDMLRRLSTLNKGYRSDWERVVSEHGVRNKTNLFYRREREGIQRDRWYSLSLLSLSLSLSSPLLLSFFSTPSSAGSSRVFPSLAPFSSHSLFQSMTSSKTNSNYRAV
jgi:hypothetical protein